MLSTRHAAGSGTKGAQVVRMLDADHRANGGSFLAGAAMEDAVRLLQAGPARLLHAGDVIGSYRLGERIGAGGMGIVYEAEDLRLHRRVAIKVLPPGFAKEGEEQIRRFEREARAELLLSHPSHRYFDFSTRRTSDIANIPRKPELFTHSLSVSPDGKWMLYTQLDQVGSEITMLTHPQ